MNRARYAALFILLAGLAVGFFVFVTEKDGSRFAFKLGLDLAGGTQLTYQADTKSIKESEVGEAMAALRDVVERRVNLFGVAEPLVQLERGSAVSGEREHRLIVELPGVADVDRAVEMIGRTPLLEFKLLDQSAARKVEESAASATSSENAATTTDIFVSTGLTGGLLKKARLQFTGGGQIGISGEPTVELEFNKEGSELFAKITGENVGEILAIFLDGEPISTPVIRDEIKGGKAVITGSFTPKEAKELVRDLNFGALPVPIELVSSQTIGATLGNQAVEAGIKAGITGFAAVAFFMISWYRMAGAVAILSLTLYAAIMLAIFKLIPVTLTASGITGFILSVGMAVDANILIFERIKDELRHTKERGEAVVAGFQRAWLPIRDANITSIISAAVLFWLGTSVVQGFALTWGIGVLVSMLTAITVSKTLLLALHGEKAQTRES